jgi:hypothetical protein
MRPSDKTSELSLALWSAKRKLSRNVREHQRMISSKRTSGGYRLRAMANFAQRA